MAEKDGLQTLKEILTWEIHLPFTKLPGTGPAGGKETDLSQDEQLNRILQKLESEGKELGSLMVDQGILTQEQLERVRQEQQKSGLGFPQALIRLKIMTPGQVTAAVKRLGRVIADAVSGTSLAQLLENENLVIREDLDKARQHARDNALNLEQALLELKLIDLKTLGALYQKHFSIPWVSVKSEKIDETVARKIPEDLVRERSLLAFRRQGNQLHVAMADPRDQALVDRLQIMTGFTIKPYLADLRELGPPLRRIFPDVSESRARIQEIAKTNIGAAAEEESTVQLVNSIIEGAVNSRATDIHLDPNEDHLRVRYRIDGLLYDILTIDSAVIVPVTARLKVLADMNITERRRPQDGHVSFSSDGKQYDLRMSTLPTHFGEKIVLRVLDDTSVVKGMRQLGFEEKDFEAIEKLIRRPYGMFLVTGPIGSGKTTTLYAALSEVNHANRNIITIEDPIEYQLPGINQVQVDPNINLTFAHGLRGILRQDADILMVGEIRDSETARTAVRAAMTGHLLFSTMHTNYAANAITTLQHLDIRPFLIAGSVICVVAQRLVRKVCESCAESYIPSVTVRMDLGLARNSRKSIKRAVGCSQCFHTGYAGRTGVYEVFQVSERIKELILDGAPEAKLVETAREEGMTTLEENGKSKVLAGETTFEEFVRIIHTV